MKPVLIKMNQYEHWPKIDETAFSFFANYAMPYREYLRKHPGCTAFGFLIRSNIAMLMAAKGIPVVIMEPLRGGKLVHQLPEKAKCLFADYKVKRSPADWAFRWLYNQPEIMCVLSGMNSVAMVKENVKTADASQINELTEEEFTLYKKVVEAINEKIKVPCTGCRYCMPCPKQVDIPGVFSAYNKKYTEGRFHGMVDYMMCTILRKDITSASNCIGCGKCETHCPQGIKIREELKKVQKEMEGPVYKLARKIIPLFMKY
jgi:predicted aldo/keto reductase-like oxidoreductase